MHIEDNPEKEGETKMTLDGAIPSIGLNPKWTFEEFVIKPSNAFAHAAALAVAQSPGAAYNPLYIFGGQGLGKTHLMQAIGHRVLKMTKKSVLYVATETMLKEYIEALQSRTISEFRHKYLSADVLLVDDIHFLANKERLQDEFFHIFNALYAARKQIIMTSDRPANEIAGLEQRLVSRFEWGLVPELEKPDFETRLAILRYKQTHAKVPLADDLLNFIAENVKPNVRNLESALLRAISFASVNEQLPTIKSMRHLLRDLINEDSQEGCAGEFQESRPADGKGQQTGSPLARPVHIEDNPENEGETNVTLSTTTREDGTPNPGQAPSQVQLPDEAHAEAPVGFSGLPTGFPSLDSKLKGLNPAEVIVLASRPTMGKTTLALKIAKCVALGKDINGCPMKGDHDRQHAVAFFSIEWSIAVLATRMHCSISGADTVPGKAPVIVDTDSLDIMDICARARYMKMNHKVELIIIDYIQLCNCREFAKQGRRIENTQISKQIKAMAKELNIPVIVTMQLCRRCEMQSVNSRRPSKVALCDACGLVVQEADTVLILNRPNRVSGLSGREDDGVIIVDVTKNSNGPTGEVRLDFDGVESAPFVETPTENAEVPSDIVLIDFSNDRVPPSVSSVQSVPTPAKSHAGTLTRDKERQ